MQEINTYLRASSVKATLVNEDNTVNTTKASITIGMQAELVLHLFHGEEIETHFVPEDFLHIASWIWYADSDYDKTTTHKLIVTEGITVDAAGLVHIPILETSTEQAISFLGNAETKDLKCELAGFEAGNTKPVFILQWEISIRNRVGYEGGGQPVPVGDSSYTKAQVDALIAAPNTVEYTADGETWSAECPAGATHRRYKNSAVSGAVWTIESLVRGAEGTSGATYFPVVAYASDNAGTDFSLTPADDLKYRAEFFTSVAIPVPTLDDFTSAGAAWIKYIGDNGKDGEDGEGTGDMSTSDYVSSSGSGVVISAANATSATSAGAVQWSGVTGKPERFVPAAHSHAGTDISDGARQTVFRASNPQELYIDRQIIQRENAISNGVLDLDFSAIYNSSGGSIYAGSAADVFTWEYWTYATTDIYSVNIGSSMTISALEDEPLPEELPAKASQTLHVFAIRAFYKSGATQNLKLTVNYLYSTEA